MKVALLLGYCILLTGCAYTYQMGVRDGAPPNEATTIEFNNVIKMAQIDDELFEPKFSFWVGGSHTVRLAPGVHSFRFKYDARSQNGGYYTPDFHTLRHELLAGKTYELTHVVTAGRIRFFINEKSAPVTLGQSADCKGEAASSCEEAKVGF